jgi:peptidoglycan/xylan/chitin deacetylase (PgdA/CDA1 family)
MTPPVLLYHKIDTPTPDVKIRGAFTAPSKFERQMLYLKRRGWSFYQASELLKHFAEHGEFPAKGLSVTFDDGWKDNYRFAFPILKRLEIKATIFLVPACVGRTTDLVTAEGEGPREHLSADEVREMAHGGIEFGSHSMNHVLMNSADESTTRSEIVDSKDAIEDLTQRPCTSFAYPAGFFTDTAKNYVKEAGYVGAFTTVYGDDACPDLFALNRLEILRRHGRPFQFGRKIRTLEAE